MPVLSLLVGVLAACLTCGFVGYVAGVYRGVHLVNRQQQQEIVELRDQLHDNTMRMQEALEDTQWLEQELHVALAGMTGTP